MLTDMQSHVFNQQLLHMRIINVSLAVGVAVFAVYNLLQGNKMVAFGTAADLVFLPPGLLAAVGGWLVMRIMPTSSVPANAAQLAATDPEAHDVLRLLVNAQLRMIVTCAVFEGGAFVSLTGFMMKHDPLYLAVASVLFLFIVFHFPRRGALLEQVETQLRELREEKALSGAQR